jgi:hypothetical protein
LNGIVRVPRKLNLHSRVDTGLERTHHGVITEKYRVKLLSIEWDARVVVAVDETYTIRHILQGGCVM